MDCTSSQNLCFATHDAHFLSCHIRHIQVLHPARANWSWKEGEVVGIAVGGVWGKEGVWVGEGGKGFSTSKPGGDVRAAKCCGHEPAGGAAACPALPACLRMPAHPAGQPPLLTHGLARGKDGRTPTESQHHVSKGACLLRHVVASGGIAVQV